MEEDMLNDHALPTLDPVSGFALGFQQLLQLRRQVEDATFEVLRCTWVQPDLTGLQVDLTPPQRQDLAVDAPTGNERKRHDGLHRRGEMLEHRQVLLPLEEPG